MFSISISLFKDSVRCTLSLNESLHKCGGHLKSVALIRTVLRWTKQIHSNSYLWQFEKLPHVLQSSWNCSTCIHFQNYRSVSWLMGYSDCKSQNNCINSSSIKPSQTLLCALKKSTFNAHLCPRRRVVHGLSKGSTKSQTRLLVANKIVRRISNNVMHFIFGFCNLCLSIPKSYRDYWIVTKLYHKSCTKNNCNFDPVDKKNLRQNRLQCILQQMENFGLYNERAIHWILHHLVAFILQHSLREIGNSI